MRLCTAENLFFAHQCVPPDFFHDWDLEVQELWTAIANQYTDYQKRDTRAQTIPKTMHMLWIGDSPIPPYAKENMKRWQDLNPDYELRFWKNNTVEKHGFSEISLFRDSISMGARVDILRYLVLERFGGIYIDMDMVPVRPIGETVKGCSFIAGLTADNRPSVNNALIACEKGSLMLREVLSELALRGSSTRSLTPVEVIQETGAGLITDIFLKKGFPSSYVLPSSYFYPWPSLLRSRPDLKESFVDECTVCLHDWACSWTPDHQKSPRLRSKLRYLAKKLGL